MLKKTDFKDQTREDNLFELDRNYRTEILRVFNKQMSDFNSISEYDDYLADIE